MRHLWLMGLGICPPAWLCGRGRIARGEQPQRITLAGARGSITFLVLFPLMSSPFLDRSEKAADSDENEGAAQALDGVGS